ncbi:hypothetical protein Q7C_1076 [Methylophaga frappieri]|uniref:Uncharacterized protein n=1 Tax=Methylophaga frappieri (strain ATCC BAA-2434 / DSM 25690 / JAM7) TaxID=754477 RepID=I1YH40_METFJ|nr:hypothetical protein [Methylophaga frappieri]AFJ02233.1 hypothetical protein Q7C_1076 [Methylophaga frappieri]
MLWQAVLPAPAYGQTWQVTEFELYGDAPVDEHDWIAEESASIQPALSDEMIQDIEEFLGQTAKLYAKLGFADPVAKGAIDSVVIGKNGRKVIRVYVYPTENGPGGWYSSGKPCAMPVTSRKVLNINTFNRYKGKQVSDAAYQTLAHELFHAVQRASDSHTQCGLSDWISEGTADAVAYFASNKLRKTQFKLERRNIQTIKLYGARGYNTPLNKPEDALGGYLTSSFWRYLAEVSAASRQGIVHPGAAPADEDYRYLADLLNTPYTDKLTPDNEIKWLNRWMRTYPHIRTNLATAYSGFVTTFAEILHTRVGQLSFIPDPTEWEPRWLKRLFGRCPFVGHVSDFDSLQHQIVIKENGAACFFIMVDPNTNQSAIKIELVGTDVKAMQQLRIGMQDGSFLSAPILSSRSEDYAVQVVASWTFPALKNTRMTFVVANMASEPERSQSVTPDFQIMAGNYRFTLGGGEVGPVLPGIYGPQQMTPPASSGKPNPTKPTRKKLAEKKQADALRDPAMQLSPVGKANRKNYADPTECNLTQKQLNLCDAQLLIDLQVVGFPAQRAMLAADSFESPQSFLGVNPNNLDEIRQVSAILDQEIAAIDGRKIRIAVPKIDYGFSGQFDNAELIVAKANDSHYQYRAYGPTVRDGNRTYHQPPNGRVHIKTYSPTQLSGTFEADLIDEANPGPDEAPLVATQIRGEFLIPSPWRGDDDFQVDEQSTRQALIQNTLKTTPFGAAPIQAIIENMSAPPADLCAAGITDAELSAMGFKSGCGNQTESTSAVTTPHCRCDCAVHQQESAQTACQSQCQTAWQTCPSPASETAGDKTLAAQAAELDALLKAKNLPDAIREANIATFRALPEPQRLQLLEQFRQ